MKIHIGATAAAIAFGGERKAIVINCIHKWEEWDFGRLLHCVFCGLTAPRPSRHFCHANTCGLAGCVEEDQPDWHLHHRSCALRSGGSSCTC